MPTQAMTRGRCSFDTEPAVEDSQIAMAITGPPEAAARLTVYIIFLLLGIGTLLPFNVFITERDFFEVC